MATPDSVRVLLKRGLGFKPAECWEWSPGAGTLSALCASPSPEKGLGPLLNVHLPGIAPQTPQCCVCGKMFSPRREESELSGC